MNTDTTTIIMDSIGVKDTIKNFLQQGKVEDAISLFIDNSKDVDQAIREYNTDTHSIMFRKDKQRKDKEEYRTAKLPRNWQQYINGIAAFFMFGNPLKWELDNEHDAGENGKKAFKIFQKFQEEQHYVSRNHEFKLLAGAETEAAKLYAIYKDEGKMKVKTLILSKSKKYLLRPLFNEYGDLKAFAIGFNAKDILGNIMMHWDIYMSDVIYECYQSTDTAGLIKWNVNARQNPVKKIPVIYVRQPKEWDGVQERIEHDEWNDSKQADTVEYFGDPYLKISKQVKNGLADAKEVGKLIEVTDKDDVFEYVTPPDAPEMKQNLEKKLKESILIGSFTPDLSYENIKGLGAISGEAESKANVLGHIKKNNRRMIYDEVFERDKNLQIAILSNVLYPEMADAFSNMEVKFSYQDPFMGSMDDNSEEIARWREAGVMSIEACVKANRNVHNKELEIERIKQEEREKQLAELATASAESSQQNNTEE